MFFNEILNFLYKKSCVICHSKKENSFLCSECKNKIEFNNNNIIKNFDGIEIFSCCNYSGIPQNLVRLLKFHKKKFLAPEIANLMFNYISSINFDFSNYEIICVPLHEKKQKKEVLTNVS